jgi:hypothetical protein
MDKSVLHQSVRYIEVPLYYDFIIVQQGQDQGPAGEESDFNTTNDVLCSFPWSTLCSD